MSEVALGGGRRWWATRLLAPTPPLRVLDYGCGDGSFSGDLRARFPRCQVWGCDIDAEDIAACERRIGRDHVFLVSADGAPEIPVPDGFFDTVTCIDVLEHVGPMMEFAVLREMCRVLAPHGRLVVSVPHISPLAFLDPSDAKFRWPTVHRLLFALAHGRGEYVHRFGTRLRHFSSGAERHKHFSARGLVRLLGEAGFISTEIIGYGPLAPLLEGILLTGKRLPRPIWDTVKLWRDADGRMRSDWFGFSIIALATKAGGDGLEAASS